MSRRRLATATLAVALLAGAQTASARTAAFEDGSAIWTGVVKGTKADAIRRGELPFRGRWFEDRDIVVRYLGHKRWAVRSTACLKYGLCAR